MTERSTLNGVRTVFPCGPKTGQLADRYADYDAIPFFKKLGAVQCGAAGYWYVDADLAARLVDWFDRAEGRTVQVIDSIRQTTEDAIDATVGTVKSVGNFALLAGAIVLGIMFLQRGRR